MDGYTQQVRQELNFMDYVPVLFISAKTGQRVEQVLPLALQVQEERLVRLSTSQLNQILQKAQDQHPAPSYKAGKQLRSITAPRCAATRLPSCSMSTIPSWRISAHPLPGKPPARNIPVHGHTDPPGDATPPLINKL